MSVPLLTAEDVAKLAMSVTLRDLREPRSTSVGHVYVLEAGERGPMKVGFTRWVVQRLAHLQTGNSARLRILLSVPGSERLERSLHEAFRPFRIRGEWYRPNWALDFWMWCRRQERAS